MADPNDPFNRPEGTVIRPRPGAGRQGWADPARSRVAPARAPERLLDAIPPEARAILTIGLNPLVQAANPLLLLAGEIRGTRTPSDTTELRRYALNELRYFEERARTAGIPHDTVIAARYVLCAALDEAVLATPWGSQSEWSQHSLLVALHREAWGGEKFFDMLERISTDPDKHIDLMELQYLALAFGFAGKYQVLDRGHDRLATVQQELYRRIRNHRGHAPADLSIRWRGVEDRRNPVIRYVPWWVVVAAALAILTIAFTTYYARLARAAAPVHAELAKIGLEDFSAPPPPPAKGPRLKQLLAPEEARGTMTVIEQGGRTIVTLRAGELFASGSATINPAQHDTLQRVTIALNQVPGRVLVVGHTDDQAVKSLRYRDNFDLSRERAVSVVNVLKEAIDNAARISWTGVGDTQPAFQPPSDPANRARNRRVEIIHVVPGV
jgi:type VI secretion system protein ImpK